MTENKKTLWECMFGDLLRTPQELDALRLKQASSLPPAPEAEAWDCVCKMQIPAGEVCPRCGFQGYHG